MLLALTHVPSPNLEHCQRTFVATAPIDYALAVEQHRAYCQMLRQCGTEVQTLTVNRELPDCVFIEDTAIVLDEVAVMASMGAPSRHAEPAGIEPELKKYREIERIQFPATLEGGDVLRIGRKLLVGLSSRTNLAGIKALDAIVRPRGYEVIPVAVRQCLHLKSACGALPDGRLLVNADWMDLAAVRGFELVRLLEAEPDAANVALVGSDVCMPDSHPQTAEIIRRLGFEVQTVNLSEFAKAEGCVTCMSILFTG